MARIHAIGILVVVAAGTGLWLALSREPDVAPPLPAVERSAGAQSTAPIERPSTDRAPIAPPVPVVSPTGSSGGPTDTAATAARAAAADPANVHLLVRALADRQPLERFRWRFQPEGAPPSAGEGLDGRADLALPLGNGRLLVEAAAFQPYSADLVVPAAGQSPVQVDVFLAAEPAAAGVTIRARTLAGEPVLRLRLDAWLLAADGAPAPAAMAADADPDTSPLWSRFAAAEKGDYPLPALAAGYYAVRAQPVDGDGLALPLQPCRRQFLCHGHEALDLDCAFSPGVVLRVVTADATGPLLDLHAVVTARGVAMPVWWRSQQQPLSRPVVALDQCQLPGTATTLLALPIDGYALELRAGDTALALALASDAAVGDGIRTFTAVLPR